MRAILLQVEQSESNAQNFVRMHCVESRFMLYVMSMALVFSVTVYVAYNILSNRQPRLRSYIFTSSQCLTSTVYFDSFALLSLF